MVKPKKKLSKRFLQDAPFVKVPKGKTLLPRTVKELRRKAGA